MEKSIELGSMSRTSVKNDRWSKRGAHKIGFAGHLKRGVGLDGLFPKSGVSPNNEGGANPNRLHGKPGVRAASHTRHERTSLKKALNKLPVL